MAKERPSILAAFDYAAGRFAWGKQEFTRSHTQRSFKPRESGSTFPVGGAVTARILRTTSSDCFAASKRSCQSGRVPRSITESTSSLVQSLGFIFLDWGSSVGAWRVISMFLNFESVFAELQRH